MPEEVKTLGSHEAIISLHKDHQITMKFDVVEE